MAAPSLWQLPFSSAATTSPRSSTIIPICCTKRHLVTLWSSNFYSSSSCCCSVDNASADGKKRLRRNPVKLIPVDGDSKAGKAFGSPSSTVGFDRNRLSFKSLFGKRSLWRRIFLASKKVRSVILLNVITIVYVEAIIDPEAFTIVRFAVAAFPFLPFMFWARDDSHTRNAGLELGFWVSLGYILQALGLLTSDAGRASFLSMFTVIVVPLIDGMLGSTIPVYTWFGALLSMVGVAMLESSGSPPGIGDLLHILSAVSFGIHTLRTEHISRSIKPKNVLPLLGYEMCVVALLSTVWNFVEGGFAGDIHALNPFSWTWRNALDWISAFPWIPALYTGIFSTGLCLWVEMSAMRDVSATETAIIYGLEPVWGAAFAWFLLGERWGVSGWIGAGLVLGRGGSLTVQIAGARSDSSSKESSK